MNYNYISNVIFKDGSRVKSLTSVYDFFFGFYVLKLFLKKLNRPEPRLILIDVCMVEEIYLTKKTHSLPVITPQLDNQKPLTQVS